MHTSICKIDNQQDLLYSTEKHSQYLTITFNGKNAKKNIDKYKTLNHFTIPLKLTEHCKLTISQ